MALQFSEVKFEAYVCRPDVYHRLKQDFFNKTAAVGPSVLPDFGLPLYICGRQKSEVLKFDDRKLLNEYLRLMESTKLDLWSEEILLGAIVLVLAFKGTFTTEEGLKKLERVENYLRLNKHVISYERSV